MAVPTIDIVIPVLNEEHVLRGHVEKVLGFLESPPLQTFRCGIIIADNGSTDRTPEIARELTARFPERVRMIRLDERGVGRALKRAWTESNADIVGYFDADLATDLSHLGETFDALTRQDFDLVYGSRLHPRSQVVGRSLLRGAISHLFNVLVRVYLGVRISDGQCGFKFLKRSVLPRLLAGGAVSDGWFFATEMLVVAEWLNCRLYELPVHWSDRSDSRVHIISLACQYLRAMEILRRRKPHR